MHNPPIRPAAVPIPLSTPQPPPQYPVIHLARHYASHCRMRRGHQIQLKQYIGFVHRCHNLFPRLEDNLRTFVGCGGFKCLLNLAHREDITNEQIEEQ